MLIRKCQPEDLEEILELFHNVVHTVGSKYYDEDQLQAWSPEGQPNRKRWAISLAENLTYDAEVDGAIVGFGDMTHDGYIDHLFVHKSHQGGGAALRIFRQFESDAKRLGLKELTTEASVMVKPLAERQGFTVVEKQQKPHRGVILVNYLMRKSLE